MLFIAKIVKFLWEWDRIVNLTCNDVLTQFQEAHKLLQPADKTLKSMAIEFAEFQVRYQILHKFEFHIFEITTFM